MAIYGTALLSLCLLAGVILGNWLGIAIGVDANVGGVGIAMLILILIAERLRKSGRIPAPTEKGILFWSAIYIPIVVAMAANQNVLAAIEGGPMGILAGALSVTVCFALVPVLNRLGQSDSEPEETL